MTYPRFRYGRSVVTVQPARTVREVGSRDEARRIVAAALAQHGPHAVHELLGGVGARWGGGDEAAAVEQLIEQLLSGRIVLVDLDEPARSLDAPRAPTWLSELADDPLADHPRMDGPGGEEPRPPAQPELTFVALRLLDDDGEPIREQPFSLTLPDGRTIEGVTDAVGRFAVEDVGQPGTCTIRFGELVE